MSTQSNKDFSTISTKQTFTFLLSSQDGLTTTESTKRQDQFGPNQIISASKVNPLQIILKQLSSYLVIILFFAAFISFISGHQLDGYIIVVVIIANALIGFFQEYRAEKSIELLQKDIQQFAKVIRDNNLIQIPTTELTIGDIVILEEGDRIPADCRLFWTKDFYTIESSLTGESRAQQKDTKPINATSSLGDRTNTVFMSTFVQQGQAKAIVTAIGNNTEIGKIATSIQSITKERNSFDKKASYLAKQLGLLSVFLSLFIFAFGFWYLSFDLMEMFNLSVALLVSTIPEGLPATITIALAVGARKMLNKNAIIRNLSATESLGAVNIICTDKTGTLTENKMTVEKVYLPKSDRVIETTKNTSKPSQEFLDLLQAAFVGNQAKISSVDDQSIGDPTEIALKKLGYNYTKFFDEYNLIEDLPFRSQNKFRASLITTSKKKELFVTGAPEIVLSLSKTTKSNQELINQKILQFNSLGYRTIALAKKKVASSYNQIDIDSINKLEFLGIVAIGDPIREGVINAIQDSQKAGISIKMLTGDHIETATSIGERIGLLPKEFEANRDQLIVTGDDLENLNQKEFDKAAREGIIFARLNPSAKLKITESLQKANQLVAMTGDGVNDTPALKQANVGISMGIIGTDIARETSDIVLADDNFATIVSAVRQGRIVFENIRKASYFLTSTNLAEIGTIFGALILGFNSPLSSIQILWLNLVTDGLNGAALSMDKGDEDIMDNPPRNLKENLLNRGIVPYLIIMVLVMAPLTLFAYIWFLPLGPVEASSAAFFVMSAAQIYNLLNLKHLRQTSIQKNLFDNPWLNLSMVFSLAMILLIPLTPLGNLLGLVHLGWVNNLLLLLLSSTVFWVMEIYKLWRR